VSKGRNQFYLRQIVEEASVSLIEAEDFFLPLMKQKEIEGKLEVRCPKCGAVLGTFRKYPEIPQELTCELCDARFPTSSDFLEIILEVTGEFFRGPKRSSNLNQENPYKRRIASIVE
ncbi:MAG: hypothetical protein JSV87_02470, partial [Candidatus Bathyarchaeota archaeon]